MSSERVQEILRVRRRNYLRVTSYLMTVVGLAFGLLLTILAGWELGIYLFAFGALCPMVNVMMKNEKSVEPAGHLFMFLFVAAMSAVAWRTGGLESPAVLALVVGAPMGVLLVSTRASVFWVVCAAIQLGIFGVLQFRGVEVEQLLSVAANQNITAISVVSIVVVLHILLLQYQFAFNEQASATSASEERMSDARAEAVSAHEDFGNAALVAAGGGKDGDLLARMRFESEAGLLSLEHAREQLNTMFGAMSEIEPRVEELQLRSKEIALHLETIERVSTKLDLMAVNAALEAARAGLHGVTFGPIARDMRRLAENATVEIDAIRTGITGVTSESAAVRDVAVLSVQSAESSREQLDKLNETFHGVLQLFEQSTAAAEQAQLLGRKQLDSIMGLLDAGAKNAATP